MDVLMAKTLKKIMVVENKREYSKQKRKKERIKSAEWLLYEKSKDNKESMVNNR